VPARWGTRVTAEGESIPYSVSQLQLAQGQVLLRYPSVVWHEIDDASPICNWTTSQGMLQVCSMAWVRTG
jgi:hypothetical protein